MTSWNTIFFVKMLSLWNYFTASYINMKNKCQNMYYYMKNYFYGYHDIWLFLQDHTLPLALSNFKNTFDSSLLYNNHNNKLTLSTDNNSDYIQYKFSWLSAKIKVSNKHSSVKEEQNVEKQKVGSEETTEYEIDDFIEKFIVCTNSNITPSLYTIFMCWCVYSKQWFKLNDIIKFYIIDDTGEEHCLNIHDKHISIIIKYNKLYTVTKNENHIETNTIMEPSTPLRGEHNRKDE